MDVIDMYDYYYLTNPHRTYDDRCEYGICENSIIYRRMISSIEDHDKYNGALSKVETSEENGQWQNLLDKKFEQRKYNQDVLEYMLYNVSGDTGLPAHYSSCLYLYKKQEDSSESYVECGHVCNAIPIMIGSRLETKIVTRLAEMLHVPLTEIFDADYLHKIYSGSFLVNGTFYYSVFRESNNNKICHNSKSKYRGDETVAYFYDKTCNRGVKLFTDRSGLLRVNDRDGNEVTDVTSEVMMQLYQECLHNWSKYTLDMDLVRGFFSSVKRQGLTGIDNFKNKIYTNYSIGLNTALDKLPFTAMCNPMWNSSLMIGKINLGISQRLVYPKSKSETKKQNEQKLKMCTGGMSTGYLVEKQRRRNVRKVKSNSTMTTTTVPMSRGDGSLGKRKHIDETKSGNVKRIRLSPYECEKENDTDKSTPPRPSTNHPEQQTILGSKDVKTVGLIEKLEQGEHNGPSSFNQVSVSYLPLIRVLSSTVQKLQVEHVHAESSKTVPRDAYGFICMKYMGNISTAGKNMLFAERVQVSYGHVHLVVEAVEKGIERLVSSSQQQPLNDRLVIRRKGGSLDLYDNGRWMYVVINNAVTVWSVSCRRLLEFIVFVKTMCHQFAWTKIVGNYICIYYYEGVPLLRYERGEMMFDHLLKSINDEDKNDADVLEGVIRLYFSRDELEMFASTSFVSIPPQPQVLKTNELIETTNAQVENWFMRSRGDGGYHNFDNSSLLAKHLDQYTDYTAPAKRSVSVNARKSAHINVYYQKAADLIRGFNIFADPEGYERTTAEQVAAEHGVPDWVTLRDFNRARAELGNCPRTCDNNDRSLDNFYMFRTIFADVCGFNVEDANVLDASVDLNLSYSYSFSLTFIDRTKRGLDIIVPPPRNAVSVCCWDSKGEPTTVLFVVCTIRMKEGENCSASEIGEMLRFSQDARIVNKNPTIMGAGRREPASKEVCSSKNTACRDGSISFPPFRKLSVIQSSDGNYHVYFMRNDAVLLRSVQKLRKQLGLHTTDVPNMSNATRLSEDAFAFTCKPEVNPYDVLTSLRTKITTFETNVEERVVTVDVRVHGRSDKYDGVKVVNSFGQKGLALIKDLRPYFCTRAPASYNVPVQLVMNNCSFVSRQPIGQFLQMKRNMYATTTSISGEPTIVGYTPVFFTETEPITKTCLVRFDEMMRSVIVTLGLTIFQNLKCSLDNIYNPYGVLYPPQTRQIMSLYRCVGVSYRFAGEECSPFSTRDDVNFLIKMYEIYTRAPKPKKITASKALLEVMDALHNENSVQRLTELGVLEKERGCDGVNEKHEKCFSRCNTFKLHLHGQWIKEFGSPTDIMQQSSRQPDYELQMYNSKSDTYRTVYIFGDPSLIVDALNDRSLLIDRLVDQVTANTVMD